MADFFTDRHDFAGTLRSQRARIARIEAHYVHHVPEVQSGGMNSNLHFSSTGRTPDHCLQLQILQRTSAREGQMVRLTRKARDGIGVIRGPMDRLQPRS